jgi:hypothetical protein
VTASEALPESFRFDVFISYASPDKAIADAVCAAMEAQRIRCWIAPRDILAGADWSAAIVEAIGRCRAVVLIFSANANESPQIRNEIVQAANLGRPILPFRIEAATPSKSLSYFIGGVHWLDALTPPLEGHIETLIATARRLLDEPGDETGANARRQPPAASKIPFPRAPKSPRLDRRAVVAAGACLLAAAAGGAYWLAGSLHAGAPRAVVAFGQPSELDLARIRDVAARRQFTLPELAFKPPSGDVDPAALRFVGVWASEVGYDGVGRQAMLVVTSARGDGRAEGFILGGPSTSASLESVGAYTLPFVGEISDGALEIKPEHARISYTVRFNLQSDGLTLSANRPDGRAASVVLKPLWRAAS